MPERNTRKSPSRAAPPAANNATAVRPSPASPRKKSPARVSRRAEKSPARTREKSPGRRAEKSSANRTEKSPSRRTGRSPARRAEKSPARRSEKSPARRTEKSPSRAIQKSSPIRRKSPGRKPKSPIKQQPVTLDYDKEEIIRHQQQVFVPNHARGDEFFMSDIMRSSREASTSSSVVIRRSTRVITNQEIEDKYEETKGIEQLKVAEDSDLEYPEKPAKLETKQDKEFGGTFGAYSGLLLLEISLLAAHIYSSKEQYGLKDFNIPLDWRAYLDIEVAALYLGFVVLQLILSILPIGKLADGLPGKLGKLQYRCNGFLSLMITMLIFGTLYYLKYPVTVVVDKYIQFYVTGIICGHILALILYIKGGRAPLIAQNPYAVTGNLLYDFYMGREINPRVGPFDIKIGLMKIGVIGLIVVNAAIILKSWEENGGYSPTLLVASGLQIWYAVDGLWFEESFLATFEVMYEGTGLMLAVAYHILPFIYSLITRFILTYRLESPLYSLILIAVINTVGFVIYRGSNSQKYEFRKNPLNPALAHLETIPTSRGKKILVSGWWGWVRHPNYLGDIIMHWCFALPCGLAHPLPYAVSLLTTLVLFHRAKRDDARCRQRYNTAWELYCSRVKYHIIPKVY